MKEYLLNALIFILGLFPLMPIINMLLTKTSSEYEGNIKALFVDLAKTMIVALVLAIPLGICLMTFGFPLLGD